MRILFHITGYKDPGQFAWIYRALYNERDLFVIHIDQKSSEEIHKGFRSIVAGHTNTRFVPSLPIVWGGVGLIDAELAAIKHAFNIDPEWHYLVNLSAQDYPLISMSELRAKLRDAWPRNFVECKALSTVHWRIRKRLWFRYIEHRNKRHFTPIPRLISGELNLHWYGAWWHILSREFCEWWSTAARARAYYRTLRTAGMPDELLVQNIIQDSPFQRTVIPECKHEILWSRPGDPLKTTAHPNVLTMRDRRLLANSKAYFARKFDRSVDLSVLQFLAKRTGAIPPQEEFLR